MNEVIYGVIGHYDVFQWNNKAVEFSPTDLTLSRRYTNSEVENCN